MAAVDLSSHHLETWIMVGEQLVVGSDLAYRKLHDEVRENRKGHKSISIENRQVEHKRRQ